MAKKSKIIFMIIAGLILVAVGIFASLLLIQSLQTNQASTVEEVDTVKTSVVIITRNLFLGDTIGENDVELVSVPVEIAPSNALTEPEDAVGKIIKTDLVQGEMVLAHNLADPTNNNKDLSFILGEDHVMMAFPADDLMSREAMVKRGDIIDIFATFEQEIITEEETSSPDDEPVEPEMRTFTVDSFQNVSVTAMILEVIVEEEDPNLIQGQDSASLNSPNGRIRAYLLALSPQNALILKHLKDINAVFDIVLRAPTSTIQFELTPVTEEFIIEFYGLEIFP